MPTNKEILKDKIRGDVGREQALEIALRLAEELGEDVSEMTDVELLNWANSL